jgi:hypothetical protein
MGKYDDQMGEPISHTAAAKILERIQAQQKEIASTEIEQREGDEILDKTPVERVGASASRLAEGDRVRSSRARPDARREREKAKRVLGSSVEDDQWQRLRDHLLYKSRNQDATILKQGRELEDPRRRVSQLGYDAYEQRRKAEKLERGKARGHRHKLYSRVIMELRGTVVPDAQGTFEAAMRRYGRDASRRSDKFKITDEAVGQLCDCGLTTP